MTYSRVDANQSDIVAALRSAGATVVQLHTVGKGCPDIAVGHGGINYLVEIKFDKGRLTPHEERFHADWRGIVHVVRTVDDALRMIGVLE